MCDGVTRWEYKLIHLNLAPPAGASAGVAPQSPEARPATPAPEPATPTAQAKQVFSKAYLEQEFPDFYAHPPAAGQAQQPANPVLQLQGFLNTQGQDGWCLIGFYNVGPLLIMAFRRRQSDQPADAPTQLPAQEPLLQDILQRLQRLEQEQQAPHLTAPVSLPGQSEQAWILNEQQRSALPRQALCTTADAAKRLGFRSSVSLNSFLRRHGYAPGLVKLGASGWAAVYDGTSDASGSRRQHQWLLVQASQLEHQQS